VSELDVTLTQADGQGKAEGQISSQVENFIAQHVDAIILNPFDREGCAPAVQKDVDAKIPLVVVNAQVTNLDLANTYVGSNDVEAGRIEMQYIADLLKSKGDIAIIHRPNGHSAEVQRTQGNKEILQKYRDRKVLFEQTANWDRAQALNLTENWPQSGRPLNAIAAQNDEMVLGAYKAIEAAGKAKEIPVIGIDAIADAVKSVKECKMAATVFQDGGGQGATAVELAVKILKGEQVPTVVDIRFKLITKENVNTLQ
jgi:inositol transport system substrate-binding protein